MANDERLHSLDSVRAGALLLGVVFHAGFSFIPGMIAGIWATADNAPSTAVSVLLFVSHMFRMSLFFLIAGFFARMMFVKKGARGFATDRAKRILGPLVVGWVVLFPAIAAVWSWGVRSYYGGAPPAFPAPPAGAELPAPLPLAFPLTHLWFLYVLLLLYVLVAVVRSVVVRLDRDARLRARIDGAVRTLVRSGAAALALGVPLALLLARQSPWVMYFGIPTPDQSLIPPLPSFVGFAAAFSFGWLLNRQPDLLDAFKRSWLQHLVAALGATGVCLAIVGLVPQWLQQVSPAQKLGYALAYALALWCWVFAIVGVATRYLANESPVRRYVADSSYWLYLVHLPVVAAFQVLVAKWPLHWAVKFPIVLAASFAVLFVSYHWLVRFTFIGKLLNGRKHVRARAPARAAASLTEPRRA